MRKRKSKKKKVYKKRKGVLKRCPKTHQLTDVARSLTQARSVRFPKEYDQKIVHTPQYKVFPYHIATRKFPFKRKK